VADAPTAQYLNDLTGTIIGAAIRIHRTLGPGLLESAYLACLVHELTRHRLRFEAQKAVPLCYDELSIACAYRADLIVEGCVVLELKASTRFHPCTDVSFGRTSGWPIAVSDCF
jgi:GxxExxY protein